MRKTFEAMGLVKRVTYLCLAAILILLHASIAVAQEPVRVVQPAIDAGATVGAQNSSSLASDSHGGVSIAKPLELPIPTYPQLAVKYRIVGTVKIAVEIDAAGKITSARALDGPMILRRPALDAAYNAHFSPAQIGDKRAKTKGIINYKFRLADHNTEEVSAAPVKLDSGTSFTTMPSVERGESKVPDTMIPNGDLKEKVNAVNLDPTNSGADKLAGESRKSSAHDIVHLKGTVPEKVSAVPVKSDPAALANTKPATESGESKVPDTLNSKGEGIEKDGAVTMKPDPAGSIANKPAVESEESKVPDTVKPDGDRNATATSTVSQPVVTPLSLTTTYRVGVGDILDVRILGDTSKKSTLVSVLEGGVLDYHLAGDPVVGGMTLEEIRALLTTELKRRSADPELRVAVGVRDYASHTVTVSGLVAVPGNKILRREAVPLYVALAEAQPRPDADRVQISCRATGQITLVSLNDPLAMETLVHPGDVINVAPRPSEFYYIAGFVNVPGQKSLPLGITLMQAIMSAGGVSRPNVARVEIGRQMPDGFVSFERYNLKEIKAGKMKDPPLRPGDRIEVLKP